MVVRARRPARGLRDAGPQRRRARRARRRARVRLGRWRAWRVRGPARRRGGGRPIVARGPTIPLWAAVACFGLFLLVVAPWFVRQLVVFGSLLPSSASGRVLFIRDIAEWNSITSPTHARRTSSGQGIGSAPREPRRRLRGGDRDLHRPGRARCSSCRSWSSAPGCGAGPSTSGRSSSTRRSCSRSRPRVGRPRARRHVHPLGRGAGAVQLHPRARGHRGLRRLGRPTPARRGTSNRDARCSSARRVALAVAASAFYGLLVQIRGWDAIREQRITVAQRSTLLGASHRRSAHVDRRGRVQLLDRPRRRGLARRPDRHVERRRARLRHPLAGPRAARDRSGARTGPQGRRRGPHWIGAPVYTLDAADDRPELAGVSRGRRSTPSASSQPTRGAATGSTAGLRDEPPRDVAHAWP